MNEECVIDNQHDGLPEQPAPVPAMRRKSLEPGEITGRILFIEFRLRLVVRQRCLAWLAPEIGIPGLALLQGFVIGEPGNFLRGHVSPVPGQVHYFVIAQRKQDLAAGLAGLRLQ